MRKALWSAGCMLLMSCGANETSRSSRSPSGDNDTQARSTNDENKTIDENEAVDEKNETSVRVFSELWGADGGKWDPNGRLADFTKVGYMEGASLPRWPIGADVSRFGATPNDQTDDSQAFLDAIAACPEKHAILVPRGRYHIMQQLKISKNSISIRGEDLYETVLFFPKNLIETDPKTEKGHFFVFDGQHQGIEQLSLVFREQMKFGHWEFRGADAIAFLRNAEHGWAHNLYLKNADHGISVSGTHISVTNIIFDHSIVRPDIVGSSGIIGWVGHVGIGMMSRYSLYHNIEFKGRFFHEIDIINAPSNNVVSNVTGPNLSLDHHGQGASHNLYTNVDTGQGERALDGLVDTNRQQNETLWGIYGVSPLKDGMLPENSTQGHVFVGFDSAASTRASDGLWIEQIDPKTLSPENLYLAQMQYRGKPLPPEMPSAPSRVASNAERINPVEGLTFDVDSLGLTQVHRARLRVNSAVAVRAPFSYILSGIPASSSGEGVELGQIEITEDHRDMWLEFDVTSFAAEQVRQGATRISFAIKNDKIGSYHGYLASSDGGHAPLLVVERNESTNPGPPLAPTGVKTISGAGHILLDWDDSPEPDVVSYNVYRSRGEPGGTHYGRAIATGLVLSEFADVTLAENRANCDLPSDETFYYVVTAVDERFNESELSVETSGTALPGN